MLRKTYWTPVCFIANVPDDVVELGSNRMSGSYRPDGKRMCFWTTVAFDREDAIRQTKELLYKDAPTATDFEIIFIPPFPEEPNN